MFLNQNFNFFTVCLQSHFPALLYLQINMYINGTNGCDSFYINKKNIFM